MKKLSCYIGLLMATLWLAACKSDTPLEPETTVGDGEQVLEITVDGDFYASSRSTAASAGYKLVSSQAIQHIEHMYAYIFKCSTEEDGTEKTECVYVAKLPWEQNSQQGPASLTYRLKEANLPQYGTNDMQVLVVAVDNNTDTYNFPYDGVTEHADNTNNQEDNNPIIGKSLTAVKLELAEAAAGTTTSDEDKAFKMANTEVFSGLASFKADDQIIKVSLQRCVAGLLCYLTDIPYYVGSGTEEVNKISSIELQLGNGLNLNTEYDSFYDGTKFGSEASSNNVIASVNILEYIYGNGTTSGTLDVQPEDASLTEKNTQRLYVPAMDNGVVKTKENTILFGAYLLPIKNTVTDDNTTNATLKLVLKANNEVQQTAFIVKNTVTSISGADGTTISEPAYAYAYSLKANRLYSIGSKPFATDTDADQPASLKGKEIELNVLEWSNGNINNGNDVNFPVYSLKSTISADWETQYENYIFNCMSETRTVYIYPSEEDAQSLNFKVQVAYSDEFKNNPWVKFRFIDEETRKPFDGQDEWYTTIDTDKIPTELKGKTRMALEVRLNDYVKENDILGNSSITDKKDALLKDFRTANLQLVNSSNSTVLSSVLIQQFNAITVKFDYDKKSYTVGFSRVDLWDTMADNGVAKGEGRYDTWGFPGIVIPWYIYGTTYDSNVDGEVNSDAAEKINHSDYTTSVLYYARVKTVDDELGDGRHWYLPAREELGAFFNNVVKEIGSYNVNNLIEVVNVHHDAFYWSSSSDGVDNGRNSYVMKDTDSKPSGMRRIQSAYCRQARKFN